MRTKFLFIPILIFQFFSKSQSQDYNLDYAPIASYAPEPGQILHFRSNYLRWPSRKPIANQAGKLAFFKHAQSKAEMLHSLDSLSLLMFSDTMSGLLNQIKDNIVAHNPGLETKKYSILVYKSSIPNAFSLGEGCILFSLGLLERMKTVDEAAFVIAHEMTHEYFNHAIESAHRRYEEMFDKENRKAFRLSFRSRMYRYSSMENFMNSFEADHMQFSRNNEMQADSMAIEIMARAGYQISAGHTVLKLLDEADNLRFEDTLNLKSVFHFASFPFRDHWLDTADVYSMIQADSLFGEIPDSLKTHPDCDQRIENIGKLGEKVIASNSTVSSQSVVFEKELPRFAFESLMGRIQNRDYTTALFIGLHLQKAFPENKFVSSAIVNALLELAILAEDGRYLSNVGFPSRWNPPGQNQILTFLQNQHSGSLKMLASNIIEKYSIEVSGLPYGAYLKLLQDHQHKIPPEKITEYESRFPGSYFIQLLHNQPVTE